MKIILVRKRMRGSVMRSKCDDGWAPITTYCYIVTVVIVPNIWKQISSVSLLGEQVQEPKKSPFLAPMIHLLNVNFFGWLILNVFQSDLGLD